MSSRNRHCHVGYQHPGTHDLPCIHTVADDRVKLLAPNRADHVTPDQEFRLRIVLAHAVLPWGVLHHQFAAALLSCFFFGAPLPEGARED